MSTTCRSRGRRPLHVGLMAAVLLPVCTGFASIASARDNQPPFNLGELRVKLGRDATSFQYELSYDVAGAVTHVQILVGQQGGDGFSIWLCGTENNPGPAGTPKCPGPRSGEVKGTVSAQNVIGPDGRGVAAGEFGELLKAMRDGTSYANVHTTKHTGGELRGKLK